MRNQLFNNLQNLYQDFSFRPEEEAAIEQIQDHLCDLQPHRGQYTSSLVEEVQSYLCPSSGFTNRLPIPAIQMRRPVRPSQIRNLRFDRCVNSNTVNSINPFQVFEECHSGLDLQISDFMQKVIFTSKAPQTISRPEDVMSENHHVFIDSLHSTTISFASLGRVHRFYIESEEHESLILRVPKASPMIWEMDYMIPTPGHRFSFSLRPVLLNPEVIELFEVIS